MPSVLRRATLGAFILIAFGLTSSGQASVLRALDLEELVGESDAILVGEVVLSEFFVYPNGMLGTSHRIRVERDVVHGVSGETEVLVETLGGRMGRLGMRVEGTPTFKVGERVVLFLRAGKAYAAFWPVGMGQGVMRVRVEDGVETVTQSRAGMLLMRRGSKGRLQPSAGALPTEEPLDTFLSRVRAILEQKAGADDE